MAMPSKVDSEKQFASELAGRVRTYFSDQKKLSTITLRAFRYSLIDFPIILVNFPFILGAIIMRTVKLLFPKADKIEKSAQWVTHPQHRNGSLARRLPPYQSFSTKSQLRAFRQFVVRPLRRNHAVDLWSREGRNMEETLMEPLTSWEKIPNLMETILTVPCWIMGIKFLGLDPKTAFLLSRDVALYKKLSLAHKGFFQTLYMEAKWLFGISIPWSYSLKLVAVGLMAYVLLMIIVEYVSVNFYYREGFEKKLVEKIRGNLDV